MELRHSWLSGKRRERNLELFSDIITTTTSYLNVMWPSGDVLPSECCLF